MAPDELVDILSRLYRDAPKDEAMAMVHLFGIKYAAEIRRCGESVPQLVRRSCVPNPHKTEVYKGMRLAKYVTLRPAWDFRI